MKVLSAIARTIPPAVPRVRIVARVIDGEPLLFTSDGKYIEGQLDLSINAPLEGVLNCRADLQLEPMVAGWPE